VKRRTFRIISPTVAIQIDDPRHMSVAVPSGAELTTETESLDGSRLVCVMWQDQEFMMFSNDLRERGTPVD
jgi:hypothetical protein